MDNIQFQYQPILDRHRALDLECRRNKSSLFVSGWQTSHPDAGLYLPSEVYNGSTLDVMEYTFLNDDVGLRRKIIEFHSTRGEHKYDEDEVFVTTGASPLILAQFLLLRSLGVNRAYFIPPIYYTYFYFAKVLGLELIAAAAESLHAPDFELDLPDEMTYLFLTDPIWIMGVNIHPHHLNRLMLWQQRTGSVIFVDGTFQYFSWSSNTEGEQSAAFDRERTVRLICPTKSLALHGVRFAYLLIPRSYREEVRYACSNTTGATGVFEKRCAHRIMDVLNSSESNSRVREYVKGCYRRFHENSVFTNPIVEPHATYYAFVEIPLSERHRFLCMDQTFFGLTKFPHHIRFNLLTPYDLLNGARDA